MNQLAVVGESEKTSHGLRRRLSSIFEIDFKPLDEIDGRAPGPYTLVDSALDDPGHLTTLKEWLRRKPHGAKVIFLTDRGSHLQDTRAFAVGATDIIHRPVEPRELLTKLWGDVASLSEDPANKAIRDCPTLSIGVDAIHAIFSSACLGEPLDAPAVEFAGNTIVSHIESAGLAAWLDVVRTHHSQTYQHCLLVTGLAVGFGQEIGLSRADRQRLSFAGLLHDIGKARIPLAILEKAGPLDPVESAIMQKHPQYGVDALTAVRGLPYEMYDMVLHHHEYLDGSGYPHGLSGEQISDLVRVITITDVFGTLIERRSYQEPLSGQAAYNVLVDMGGKLDQALVRAFKFATRLGHAA